MNVQAEAMASTSSPATAPKRSRGTPPTSGELVFRKNHGGINHGAPPLDVLMKMFGTEM